MPTCSARAVASTISKIIPAKLDLQVKRKTKRLANKTIRWFVLHGSESDLSLLDHDWEKVQNQMLWSLQNCYMYQSSASNNHNMHPQAPLDPNTQIQPTSPTPSCSQNLNSQIHNGATPSHPRSPAGESVANEGPCTLSSSSQSTEQSPKLPKTPTNPSQPDPSFLVQVPNRPPDQ